MRIAIAVFIILHGVAHLPGFIVPWRIASMRDMPYKTTLLSGRVDAGDAGIRVIGLLWLAAAIVFVVAGIALMGDRPWWAMTTICVSIISLALSLLSLPEARIGAIVNAVIIVGMVVAGMAGWLAINQN